ncbi:DNA-protecting protein DprA, partial [Streptomyces rochei]|nr:DNA-protecting protein DprA [Streptomyces rochei]
MAGEPTAEDGATGVEKWAGDGLDARGDEGRGDDVGSAGSPTDDDELLGRVFLTRVVEPGDETGGRWVRERGVAEVVRRLREGGRPLPGVSAKRW